MRNHALMFAVVTAAAATPLHGQGRTPPTIETTKVAEGVYMLVGRGGNIGLSAGNDGAFLIDDQFAMMTGPITEAVEAVTSEPIRFVLNTHWHGDHTGGNENLGKAGAVIVAHENVRRRMSTEQISEFFQQTSPPSPPDALPAVTFNDTVTFHWNGQEIHVFHVAHAHTDGDSIIHFRQADVFHMGDTYFNGLYPYIDYSAGGTVEGMIAAADRVLKHATPRSKIIPGHGPLSDATQLRVYRNMLSTVRARIAALIDQDKSLDEVVASRPTAEFDEKWGGGFIPPDRWVALVYETMKRRATSPSVSATTSPGSTGR